MDKAYHVPVLLAETLAALDVRPGGIYLDGTAGGGGHSAAIAARLTGGGRLIALDQDPDAVEEASRRLSGLPAAVVRANFADMAAVLHDKDIPAVDGILLDIGVSSHQLDAPERGFSYHEHAEAGGEPHEDTDEAGGGFPLDMRMSREGATAADLVAGLDEAALAGILFRYGEEKYARSIARSIVREREKRAITTTGRLADIIRESVPAAYRRAGHPARKTFQALRIAVNGELDRLSEGLDAALRCLKPGGRLAVITFHSLEDRMVKQRFVAWCRGCTCPPDFPVCVCGKTPEADYVLRKPVTASEAELEANPRSRSAKLRAVARSGGAEAQ